VCLNFEVLNLPSVLLGNVCFCIQGSNASWKVLYFFLKIPGPGKSWKFTSILESPGKIFLKITHFFLGSNGKQVAIVYHPDCVDCCFFWIVLMNFATYGVPYTVRKWCFFVTFKHAWAMIRFRKNFFRGSWKVMEKSWIFLSGVGDLWILYCVLWQVARASALQFNPNVTIIAYHDSIMRLSQLCVLCRSRHIHIWLVLWHRHTGTACFDIYFERIYPVWPKKRPEHLHALFSQLVKMSRNKKHVCNDQTSSNMSRNICLKHLY